MNTENIILINGCSSNNLKKALNQWVALYSDDLKEDITFELYKIDPTINVIKVDNRVDDEKFFYLINYLNYPEGINYNIDIEGFRTVKNNKKLPNKKVLVYVPENDQEFDNVFVVTSDNETFKIDFGGKITEEKSHKTYAIPDTDGLKNPEIIRLVKKDIQEIKQKRSNEEVKDRFRTISLITASLPLIYLLILRFDPNSIETLTIYSGLGLSGWFFMDYKMLQTDKYYFYSLFIAVGYLLFCLLFMQQYPNIKMGIGFVFPISLLLIQKPLRWMFKQIFKREPVILKNPNSFWDVVYALILILSNFLVFLVSPFNL